MNRVPRRTFFMCATLLAAMPFAASAVTVAVDGQPEVLGSSYPDLYSAVNYVQSQGVGPHVINVTTDNITSDSQTFITTPITINGDADNDGIPCDILVDLDNMQLNATANAGLARKAYLDIQVAGQVVIRDLRIHPNDDSNVGGTGNGVNGIQMFKPVNVSEVGDYRLNNVWISGSDSSNNFVDLGTAADLYFTPGMKRWSRNMEAPTGANTGAGGSDNWACILVCDDAVGAGTIDAKIINCQAGLSRSDALSIKDGATVLVQGGLFGHCVRDAIRIGASIATVQGTPTNRIRVLNAPNVVVGGTDAHGVEFAASTLPLVVLVFWLSWEMF